MYDDEQTQESRSSTQPEEHRSEPAAGPGPPPAHDIPKGALVLRAEYARGRIQRPSKDGERPQWDEVWLRTYNGKITGPRIEARPGDTLNVFLDNHLPPEPTPGSEGGGINVPHGFNTTNLHFHGLHVSPAGNSDNVMIAIEPHQQFHYEVKIPKDHPPGPTGITATSTARWRSTWAAAWRAPDHPGRHRQGPGHRGGHGEDLRLSADPLRHQPEDEPRRGGEL